MQHPYCCWHNKCCRHNIKELLAQHAASTVNAIATASAGARYGSTTGAAGATELATDSRARQLALSSASSDLRSRACGSVLFTCRCFTLNLRPFGLLTASPCTRNHKYYNQHQNSTHPKKNKSFCPKRTIRALPMRQCTFAKQKDLFFPSERNRSFRTQKFVLVKRETSSFGAFTQNLDYF